MQARCASLSRSVALPCTRYECEPERRSTKENLNAKNLACLGIRRAVISDRLPTEDFICSSWWCPRCAAKECDQGKEVVICPSLMETTVLVRALLMAVVALLLLGCMDSERLRGD